MLMLYSRMPGGGCGAVGGDGDGSSSSSCCMMTQACLRQVDNAGRCSTVHFKLNHHQLLTCVCCVCVCVEEHSTTHLRQPLNSSSTHTIHIQHPASYLLLGAVRNSLDQLLATWGGDNNTNTTKQQQFDRLIMSHGQIVETGGQQVLQDSVVAAVEGLMIHNGGARQQRGGGGASADGSSAFSSSRRSFAESSCVAGNSANGAGEQPQSLPAGTLPAVLVAAAVISTAVGIGIAGILKVTST